MKPTKGTALHIWIQDETSDQLAKLSDVLEMSKNEIAARLITAGIKCLKEAGDRMPLPLRFKLEKECGEEAGDRESKPRAAKPPSRVIAGLTACLLAWSVTADEPRYVHWVVNLANCTATTNVWTDYQGQVSTNVSYSSDFVVPTNTLARLLSSPPWGNSTPGNLAFTGIQGDMSWVYAGDSVLGPGFFRFRYDPTVIYGFSFELRAVNQGCASAGGVLLPAGQAARLSLEASSDLQTWTETYPGIFPAATNRYFRLRLDPVNR